MRRIVGIITLSLAMTAPYRAADEPVAVRIGTKTFTESVILAEVLARLAESTRAQTETIVLGGTQVVWQALLVGEIDAYVEYTGTLRQEILAGELDADAGRGELIEALAKHGVRMSRSLGFNNTYALAVSRTWADEHRR